jgi:hypothetical protein
VAREGAARSGKAADEPARNRIGRTGEYNGDGRGRLLGGQGGLCICSENDIDLERNQLGRESREPLQPPLGRSILDHEVAPLDVTEVPQSLPKGLD